MYNFNYDGSQFKLQISEERYYINETKRTVTVTAMVEVATPEYILRTIDYSQLPVGFTADALFPFGGYDCKPVKFTATARCAPEDVWDAEKGKKIALAKLEAKAYRSMGRRLLKWVRHFRRFYIELNHLCDGFINKAAGAAEHDDRYIQDIA